MYTPTTARIIDTRPGKGGPGPLQSGGTRTVPIAGRGVPLSGVAAVTGIITAIPTVGPNGGGFLTVYPSGTALPVTSNVNFSASNGPVANQFTCPLGPDGAIRVYDGFAVDANFIIDINGWHSQPDLTVTPPAVPFDQTPPTALDSAKAAQILRNTNRYAMTAWWAGPAPALLVASLEAIPLSADGSDPARRLASQALGLSVALATGVYDPIETGVSEPTAVDRMVQLVDRVASQHAVNHLDGWGGGWQTPMWAGLCARAAWFSWDHIPAGTRRHVAQMAAYEADYAARVPVRYLRDAAGTVLTPGNSGAEEVSWTANALQTALVMFPTHPNAHIWRTELVRYSLAAWARPADLTNPTVVNGRAVSDWLAGSNVEPDGTVINHARVAPDYSSCTYQNLTVVPLCALAGQTIPRAARALLGPVYAAYRGVHYTAPPYAAPGGTVYATDSADIYYPQGCDWGTGQQVPYALADIQAMMYGYGTSETATYLELHLDAQLVMQGRHSDRHTYANTAEYNYIGGEEQIAHLATELYLTMYCADQGIGTFSNNPV